MIKKYAFALLSFCAFLQATHPETPSGQVAGIQFLVKFQEQPGTYKLKVETIGHDNKTRTPLCPTQSTIDKDGYADVTITKADIAARDSFEDRSFAEYYQLPCNAKTVRISVRKLINGSYKRGGCAGWNIDTIAQADQQLNHKLQVLGIHFKDQFERIKTGDFSQAPICPQSVHL